MSKYAIRKRGNLSRKEHEWMPEILYCDFAGKKLFMNSEDLIQRQHSTITHELGHWMLRYKYFLEFPSKDPDLPRFSRPSSDSTEKEANAFTAHLLMHDSLLKHLYIQ